jgi:hypothetical protein
VLLLSLKLHWFRSVFVCWKQLIISTMSSPTRRGVIQNHRNSYQGLRRSARISKKQPGDHARNPQGRQTKRSVSSKDTKMPKIINSASSLRNKSWIFFLILRKLILRSLKVMKMVIAITVNFQLKHHFGVLQTYHQELKSFLK